MEKNLKLVLTVQRKIDIVTGIENFSIYKKSIYKIVSRKL